MTEQVNLCKCNMCDNILIDLNPQIGAKLYNVDFTKVDMLENIKAEDDDYYFWGCPKCQTDGYLYDEIDEVKAKELGIIK